MASHGVLAGLFSGQSQAYARLRPRYPADLYDRILDWAGLAGQRAQRGLAVDLGCGSGQATADLAPLFDRVLGVDAAAEQLSHAPQLPNAEFRCRPVEDTGLPDGCADLVVVATALHWCGGRGAQLRACCHLGVASLCLPAGCCPPWSKARTAVLCVAGSWPERPGPSTDAADADFSVSISVPVAGLTCPLRTARCGAS